MGPWLVRTVVRGSVLHVARRVNGISVTHQFIVFGFLRSTVVWTTADSSYVRRVSVIECIPQSDDLTADVQRFRCIVSCAGSYRKNQRRKHFQNKRPETHIRSGHQVLSLSSICLKRLFLLSIHFIKRKSSCRGEGARASPFS